ncbi:hypothetical protein BFR40_00615 [Brochothrix thermosphacta]|uniref:hypothetical protein n=1 Tax=Brochothrix thermosphacta TaxID=2756 RepID=UPI00083F740D|nr:hypothetical protein [Brochothrix thermosphacta]ODJ53153.1 hypothetical protein BFR40_00615 [Brochothrix thermosphacta]
MGITKFTEAEVSELCQNSCVEKVSPGALDILQCFNNILCLNITKIFNPLEIFRSDLISTGIMKKITLMKIHQYHKI